MRNTFTVVLLILIAFGFGFLINNKSITTKPVEENSIVEQQTGYEVEAEYIKYESPFGFSFMYDDGLKLENTSIVLPGGYRVSAVAAIRYADKQHCSASGLSEHCRPFLENPAVAFGVMDSSYDTLKTVEFKDFIEFSEPITLAGKTGFQFYAGVEGEGVVTIVLPFQESKTLLIQYTFDEFIDQMTDQSDVVLYKSAEQKSVVDNVLKTLTIN
jgi:hypothetical protein